MAGYVYPKNRLEIVDGSLLPIASVPEDLVVVVERAYSGPSDTIYIVQDLTEAKMLYGDKSPIINLANRTRAGKAQNIALFRIGGGAHQYINIFGESTSLRLTEESVDAAKNLKVYIGPEPQNPKLDAVVIYEGSRIIYSNVLGGEINSYKVVIDGFNKQTNTLRVGTLKQPVPFTEILNYVGGTVTTSAVASEGVVTGGEGADWVPDGNGDATWPNDGSDWAVDGSRWVKVDVANVSGLTVNALNSVKIQKLSGETVPFIVSPDKTSLLIRKVASEVGESGARMMTSSAAGASDVNSGDTLSITYNKAATAEELKAAGIEYIPGKDSINANVKEIYEALDEALEKLELLPTKAVVVGDWFNTPNIAEGAKAPNRLDYLLKTEDEYGEIVYNWSEHKYEYKHTGVDGVVTTTTDITLADLDPNGQPILVREYNEVDFTHRLGMFAHRRLEDGNFLNIVIGAKGPINRSPKALVDWVGASPVRDLQGNIVENGSGLLGHRLMVGTTDYRGGYFATSTGFVDGDILVDRTGFPIDLGKHISVVISQVGSATSPDVVTSGAAAYAGLVSNLTPGESTTNSTLTGLFLSSDIKESKRRELSAAGYVVFLEKPKGLCVYSGDLATRDNSDYDYISTAIAVSEVSKLITNTADPFIGKGLDIIALTALKTNLTTVMANAQKAGWFISYEFRIRRDGPNTILIPFVIEAKDELRQISSLVRLTRSDTVIDI